MTALHAACDAMSSQEKKKMSKSETRWSDSFFRRIDERDSGDDGGRCVRGWKMLTREVRSVDLALLYKLAMPHPLSLNGCGGPG